MLYGQLILIAHNLLNVYIDAYKIRIKNKTIKHGINLGCYAISVALVSFLFKLGWPFIISAFFNRQITFDIPLNLRRGLKWNYVSLAKPPKAIMDRIEVAIFGYNGTLPTILYGLAWIITIIWNMLSV